MTQPSPWRAASGMQRPGCALSRNHRRAAAVAYAVAMLTVAWSLGLWLVVITLSSAAAVVARRWLVTRRELPGRIAAWALHAPYGLSPPVALEHALAVDLAIVSQGHLDSLERARAQLGERVDDPWRRALGEERLTTARRLVSNGALTCVSRGRPGGGQVRLAGASVALVLLLAVGMLSQALWWLLPIALVHALVAVESVALYERRRLLPELLVSQSVPDPVEGLFVLPEPDVVRSLIMLAKDDRAVIQRAQRLVERTGNHEHARHRLDQAQRLLHLGMPDAPSRAPRRHS